jgi:hypothetical protein
MAETKKTKTELDERIQQVVQEIRECKADADEIEACITKLKDELRVLLVERGENWIDDEGYARLLSEGERTSYNTAALDDLIITDPLRYGWLKDYRVKTPVVSRVQVK